MQRSLGGLAVPSTARVRGAATLTILAALAAIVAISGALRAASAGTKVGLGAPEPHVVAASVLDCAEPIVRGRPGEIYRVPVGTSPIRGGLRALVTIIEFAEFECPFCAKAELTLEDLAREYGDDLRLVFKHNPLTTLHPHARAAAEASVFALMRGRFWPFHDRLFTDRTKLERGDLIRHAEEVGLPRAAFEAAMDDPSREGLAAVVDADVALAASLGVRGTPAFFINGRYLGGAREARDFRGIIDPSLEDARAVAEKCHVEPGPSLYAALVGRGRTDPMPKPTTGDRPPDEAIRAVPVGSSPARGPKDALITIVMFADFQCPYCLKSLETIARIEAAWPKKVRVVFKHLPLDEIHLGARGAALAAVAAQRQGKFWPYHDRLWKAAGKALSPADLERHAAEVGLDMKRFRADVGSPAVAAVVNADVALALRLGARGTPAFFVNGRFVKGAVPFETFEPIIEERLAVAEGLVRSGVARAKVYEVIGKTATVR